MRYPIRVLLCALSLFAIAELECTNSQAAETAELAVEAVVAPATIIAPPKSSDGHVTFLLALKVTNNSERKLLVNECQTFMTSLTNSKGEVLPALLHRDMTYRPTDRDFQSVRSGDSVYIVSNCRLFWAQGQLVMEGSSIPGEFWTIWGPKLGRYGLRIRYSPTNKGLENTTKKELMNESPWEGIYLVTPVDLTIEKGSTA